jgi:HlyD family secretion protein
MKRVWIGIAVLAAAGVGAWLAFGRTSAPAPGSQYETVEVSKGPVLARVTATGTLAATVTVVVGTQVSGRVQELLADFNSPVKKGQVVARIDPQMIQGDVEQKRANLLAAQANVVRAKVTAEDAARQFERAKALLPKKFVSEADVDTARANADATKAAVQSAQATLAQARASKKQAEVNLAYTTIVSPIDGVVISRNVDVGQTVAAAFQAPTLFTIAEDLRKMQVHCNVSEADVGKLKPQMAATFTVDAWPTQRFSGTIREVRFAPQTLQNVVTYDAVVDVDNPELKLKPGMTASVTVVVAERQDVARVPNAALRFRPSADLQKQIPAGMKSDTAPDRRMVWVLREGTPEPVTVRVGITDGTLTEVVEGAVQPGEKLVSDLIGGSSTPGNAAPRMRPF